MIRRPRRRPTPSLTVLFGLAPSESATLGRVRTVDGPRRLRAALRAHPRNSTRDTVTRDSGGVRFPPAPFIGWRTVLTVNPFRAHARAVRRPSGATVAAVSLDRRSLFLPVG